jgi:hypothetical protein
LCCQIRFPSSKHAETTCIFLNRIPFYCCLLFQLCHRNNHSSYMTGSTSTAGRTIRTYATTADTYPMACSEPKTFANILTPHHQGRPRSAHCSRGHCIGKWMTQEEDLDVCATAAAKVFALGQSVAEGRTRSDRYKYEFGRDEETSEILLIDEVHTRTRTGTGSLYRGTHCGWQRTRQYR